MNNTLNPGSGNLPADQAGNQAGRVAANPFMASFAIPFKLFDFPQASSGNGATGIKGASQTANQVGLELVSLATRRAQALLEVPTKFGQCKTPLQFAAATAEFWQTAWTQQIESSKKIASVFGATMPVFGFPQAVTAVEKFVEPTAGAVKAAVRDVLSVPEVVLGGKDSAKEPNSRYNGFHAA